MNEFIKYIENIGFEYSNTYTAKIYSYGEYSIHIFYDRYILREYSRKISDVIPFDDCEIINEIFKKELRSYKLSKLLSK